MQTTTQIADYVANTGIADFSPEVIARTKDLCLSALGSAVAGSRMEVVQQLIDFARLRSQPAQAGIVGAGFKVAPELAAFVNSSASHCTELEDVAFPEAAYTCHLIPAMFSLADALGAPGTLLLESVILGYEVTARPGMTSRAFSRGWQATAQFGTIGAAAGAAKLLGLDAIATRNALAIAASFAGGLGRQTGTAAHVIEAGAAGQNGILAALFAQRGLNGTPTILEGRAGFWDALAADPELDFELGRGSDLRVMQVGLKSYPCCYFLQRIIDGVRLLVREHAVQPDQVDFVEVQTNGLFDRIVPVRDPRDGEEARFSLPHAVAAALVGDDVFIDTFTVKAVQDPRLAALRPRVRTARHPDYDGPVMGSDNPLLIQLKDGRQLRMSCLTHHGDPRDPLSREEVVRRFERCAGPVLSAHRMEEITAAVVDIEREPNVSRVTDLLTWP